MNYTLLKSQKIYKFSCASWEIEKIEARELLHFHSFQCDRTGKYLLTIRLITHSCIGMHMHSRRLARSELSSYSRYSSSVQRRFILGSTHIDLFARILVYSLTLSRDIGHSRIRHDKNYPFRASFRNAVNSNRSIAVKGPDRAIRTPPSFNDVEEEIKSQDHSPFVPYCLNTRKGDRSFFLFSKNIASWACVECREGDLLK